MIASGASRTNFSLKRAISIEFILSVVLDVAPDISFPGNLFAAVEVFRAFCCPGNAQRLRYFRMDRNLQPPQMVESRVWPVTLIHLQFSQQILHQHAEDLSVRVVCRVK